MSDAGSEEEKIDVPPPREAEGKKFFLAHSNTYEGMALFKELYNKEQCREPEWAAHTFIGTQNKTMRTPSGAYQEPPKEIDRIVEFGRTVEFRNNLLESDVIIYDLMSNAFEEVDYVIKTLKSSELTKPKTLVLLSSVMTWVNTPPKFEEKAEGAEEDPADPEEEAEEEEPDSDEKPAEEEEGGATGPVDEDGNPITRAIPLYFKESDCHLRVPHAKYEHLKTLETLAMSSTNTQPKLRVHVLCSGVRYGNGEKTLYDHFFKAWIQNPRQLSVIGEGSNLVPSIHVIDLARLVKRIVVDKPKEHPYIFAIDRTNRPTQKRLVKSISKGIGTGLVQCDQEATPGTADDFLSINLKMKASDALKDGEVPEDLAEDIDPEEYALAQKFPWHCEKGIVKNIISLNNEFNTFRGLNPVKMFVTGPPASGKTYYSGELAKYYNIPQISVKQLSDAALAISLLDDEKIGEDEEKTAIKAKIEELRDLASQAAEEARGDPPEGEEWPEIDRATLPIRVPEDILWKQLTKCLRQNDCRNRGYILDGFPRKYTGSQNIFLKWKQTFDEEGTPNEEPEQELEEGQEKDFSEYIPDTTITPSNCIVLTGDDEALINRVRGLSQEEIEGTHYNAKDMSRRLKDYRIFNNSEVAEPSVQDFFKNQCKISLHKVDAVEQSTEHALCSMKIYIERNEKPVNFMTWDNEIEQGRRVTYQNGKAHLDVTKAMKSKQEEIVESVLKKQKAAATATMMDQLREQQKEVLDSKSQLIRQYLLDNLVPILTDGLLDICKRQPTDPVDTLAEYLFKRSLDVPYKDPTTY